MVDGDTKLTTLSSVANPVNQSQGKTNDNILNRNNYTVFGARLSVSNIIILFVEHAISVNISFPNFVCLLLFNYRYRISVQYFTDIYNWHDK